MTGTGFIASGSLGRKERNLAWRSSDAGEPDIGKKACGVPRVVSIVDD